MICIHMHLCIHNSIFLFFFRFSFILQIRSFIDLLVEYISWGTVVMDDCLSVFNRKP